MRRAVSIHIGVNQPGGPDCKRPVLKHSEDAAWRMAVLASQAGYESLQVLRGRAATRLAVHEALTGAAGLLEKDDNLLVTFSGHGGHLSATGDKEPQDESWCLFDGEMVDNKLIGYLRLFEEGVRIVVVSESCFSGGMCRTGEEGATETAVKEQPRWRDGGASAEPRMRGGYEAWDGPVGAPRRMRGGHDPCDEVLGPANQASNGDPRLGNPVAGTGGLGAAVSCITSEPVDPLAIRAKVLLLTASGETEPAHDGVFTCALLRLWDDGEFQGTYCDLYGRLSQGVMAATRGKQMPQILIGGAAGPEFPLIPAFHLSRDRALYDYDVRYRGNGGKSGEDGESGRGQTTRGGGGTMRGG